MIRAISCTKPDGGGNSALSHEARRTHGLVPQLNYFLSRKNRPFADCGRLMLLVVPLVVMR